MIRRNRYFSHDGLTLWLSLGLAAIMVVVGCESAQEQRLARMNVFVEGASKQFVPDSRVDHFEVSLEPRAGAIHVVGEVFNRSLLNRLVDSLRVVFPSQTFANSATVLPDTSLQEATYGIINISVANMRREPRFQAELVNQTLLGTVVRLYKERNGFYFAQNWDRYLGWINKGSLVAVDSATAEAWRAAPRVVCLSNYGKVQRQEDGLGRMTIADLAAGAVLTKVGDSGQQMRVALPDGRIGVVDKSLFVDEAVLKRVQASREKILQSSRRFLGVPYLWGGTSAKGFDCSGFVQTVFRLNNIALPRDASQIVAEGVEVAPGENFENLVPADLLFFGSKPGRISHVAIYLGAQLYIHSSNSVHINSLDPNHRLYNDYRYRTFQVAKRLL